MSSSSSSSSTKGKRIIAAISLSSTSSSSATENEKKLWIKVEETMKFIDGMGEQYEEENDNKETQPAPTSKEDGLFDVVTDISMDTGSSAFASMLAMVLDIPMFAVVKNGSWSNVLSTDQFVKGSHINDVNCYFDSKIINARFGLSAQKGIIGAFKDNSANYTKTVTSSDDDDDDDDTSEPDDEEETDQSWIVDPVNYIQVNRKMCTPEAWEWIVLGKRNRSVATLVSASAVHKWFQKCRSCIVSKLTNQIDGLFKTSSKKSKATTSSSSKSEETGQVNFWKEMAKKDFGYTRELANALSVDVVKSTHMSLETIARIMWMDISVVLKEVEIASQQQQKTYIQSIESSKKDASKFTTDLIEVSMDPAFLLLCWLRVTQPSSSLVQYYRHFFKYALCF
jgi:hypothetical protein